MYLMNAYDDSLKKILDQGRSRTSKRTNIRTRSIFGMMNRYPLNEGFFPILTRRKIWPKSVFKELLWFLSGSTNNKDLTDMGCNFWTPWVDEEFEEKNGYSEGVFGPVYGFQLRHFGGHYGNGTGGYSKHDILGLNDESSELQPWLHDQTGIENQYGAGGFDQLLWLVNRIKEDHSCRRTLWTLWNPNDVHKMKLPPCHMMFQILVDDDRNMTGIMTQRSADFPIGVPANIQFYSALTIMIAQQTDCVPCEFVHVTHDSHIYENQLEGVQKYLETPIIDSPKLQIKKASSILDYKPEDFIISDFKCGEKIYIPVAV